MGNAVGAALRFVRSWDDRSGARYAELELSIDAHSYSAKAWRRQDIVQITLVAAKPSATPTARAAFVEAILVRLRSAPLCAGAGRLRLRLPASWIDHVKACPIRPASLRSVFVCDSPPRVRPAKQDLELLPVSELGYTRFASVFHEIMPAESLGLRTQVDINRLASSIWRGESIEGVEGYQGLAVLEAGVPIGVFFTLANPDGGAWLGFAGLVPWIRRSRLAAAAVGRVVEMLDRAGAFPITMEVDSANRRSLRMAERRCGPARDLVAVYNWPA